MVNDTCSLVLTTNGKLSRLHTHLVQKIANRSFANYIYAAYRSSNIPALMDSAGFARDVNGEHKLEDVMDFMKVNDLIALLADDNITIGKSMGAYDSMGNPIIYTDAMQALDKASQFNNKVVMSEPGLNSLRAKIARVVKTGNNYKIEIVDNNSMNFHSVADINKARIAWDKAKDEFNKLGLNIDDYLDISGMNPLEVVNQLNSIKRLQTVSLNSLSVEDCKTLLQAMKSMTEVPTFISKYANNDIDTASSLVYDYIHNPTALSQGASLMISNILNHRQDISYDSIWRNVVKEVGDTVTQSGKTADLIKELQNKFRIDVIQLELKAKEIKSLIDAAGNAALVLEKQIRFIRENEGKNSVGAAKEHQLDALMKELLEQRTYTGLLNFLNESISYVSQVINNINQVANTGNTLEYTTRLSKELSSAKNLYEGYYEIAKSLKHASKLSSMENLTVTQLTTLENAATQVVELLDDVDKTLLEGGKEVARALAVEFVGNEAAKLDVGSIECMVQIETADAHIWDFLYSMGRVSNPLIATMGSVIREAQQERDKKLTEFALRIRRATDKFYNAAKKEGIAQDTSFIYDNNGHLIYDQADIDWHKYYIARKKEKRRLRKLGYNTFEIKEGLDIWEENNTEEIQVSPTRSEKIPNSAYQKTTQSPTPHNPVGYTTAFDRLTDSQKKYYYEMMSIKGELGDNLPEFARQQFRAPQLRKSWLDVVSDVIHDKMSVEAGLNALADKMKFWEIKEDDTEFVRNGYISDDTKEEVAIMESDFKGEKLNKVPLFYFNRVRNDLLLKDFSGALQSWASTVCNYEAMTSIENVVNTMADYIDSQQVTEMVSGKSTFSVTHYAADMVSNGAVLIAKKVVKNADSSNNRRLVQGFIEKAIYGHKFKNELNLWEQVVYNLIKYTGLRQLAVNVKGAVSNYFVGEIQNFIEALSGTYSELMGMPSEFVNLKDWLWAQKQLFGDNTVGAPGRIIDFFTNNVNSKSKLLQEIFDPAQDNYQDMSYSRYHSSLFRQLCGGFNAYGQYAAGEYLIHYTIMYARLHHVKVKKRNGETHHDVLGRKTKYTLYDAYKVTDYEDGNSEISIDSDFILEDGSEIDEKFIKKLKGEIQYVNQNNHGSMNDEDKGLVHQYIAGRAIMCLRQWMVEHYSRRFRSTHYDYTLRQSRTGYHNESTRVVYDIFKDAWHDHLNFYNAARDNWSKLDTKSKQNVNRALSEYSLIMALLGLSFGLGDPKDHKGEWGMRFFIYQIKRALMDEVGSIPYGLPAEGLNVVSKNALSAVTRTFNDTTYPLVGLLNGDIFEDTKEGDNKYIHNVYKRSIPFVSMIEQLIEMDEDDSVFNIFDSSRQR